MPYGLMYSDKRATHTLNAAGMYSYNQNRENRNERYVSLFCGSVRCQY